MVRRRPLGAHPLLVASAGLSLAIACTGKGRPPDPVGNLMVPQDDPTEQVCVSVTPPTASVTIDGVEATDGCAVIDPGDRVHIEVSAEGYTTETRDIPSDALSGITIALTPTDVGPIEVHTDYPVGNLMAPQPVP
jgi:hypothetical protein